MADAADIAEALLARCATLEVGSPALPIAYPEDPSGFEPPADGKYLEVSLFANVPRWQAINTGKMDQGLLQVTVVWPANQGVIEPMAAADAVKAHFAKGTPLRHGTANVKISGDPWAASPLSEDSELRVPVTVPWTAA